MTQISINLSLDLSVDLLIHLSGSARLETFLVHKDFCIGIVEFTQDS